MKNDYLRYVLENIRHRKLRAWLTMLGIIIGVAAVVSLVSLGTGLQSAIDEQFELLGSDKIFILPGSSLFAAFGTEGIDLTDKDLDVVRKVKSVELAGGFISKIGQVKFRNEIKYPFILGLPTDESKEIFASFQSFKIKEGKDLQEGDGLKALVGIMYPEAEVFDKPVGLRDTISIEGHDFKIIGVIDRIGNPQDDSQIYIPIESAREVLNVPESYTGLMVQVKKGQDIRKVGEDIKEKLRKSRDVDEGEEDFTLQTSEELLEAYSTVFFIISAVIIGIATISLLVGGIGIMNTLYTAVLQRTQEIGVMKAIGAKNSDILKLFLIESGIYGLIGGAIGIIFGALIALGIVEIGRQYIGEALLKADLSLPLILGALLFSFLVGAISGVAPAYRASKLNPVEALRYE